MDAMITYLNILTATASIDLEFYLFDGKTNSKLNIINTKNKIKT